MEQLEPESAAYNICRAYRLVGNLNISALEASVNEIISRHETLRTAFRLVNGRPVQLVQPARNVSIEIADLRSMPMEEREPEMQRRISVEAERSFDLLTGQLLRCSLLHVGDQEHVLILMTHHSASDAWSMGILTRETWTLYDTFSNGKPSPFERLPVQYSDYAVWQRNWLYGEVLDTQLAYWKKRLENLSIVNLPTDRPRAARQSFRGARVPIRLPQALTASVNDLSDRSAVTPFMTLLAAFQLLIYRYTGQEDIVVGSPIANRRRPEIEKLIGFFVNTLVLRADLSGNPSFKVIVIPGQGYLPRCRREPGLAIRKVGPRTPARTRLEPQPALPIHVRATERYQAVQRDPWATHRADRIGDHPLALRSVAVSARARRKVYRLYRIQHRSVQPRQDRAHGRPLSESARSHRCRPRSIHRDLADSHGSRTSSNPCRLELHRGGISE